MVGPTMSLVIDLIALAVWFAILQALAAIVLKRRTEL
jgi:hypothetical protein